MAQRAVEAGIAAFQRAMGMVQEQKQHEEELEFRKDQQANLEKQQALQQKMNEAYFDMQRASMDRAEAVQNANLYQNQGIVLPGTQVEPGLQAPPQGSNQIGANTVDPKTGQIQFASMTNQQPLVTSEAQNTILRGPTGAVSVVPPLAQTPAQQLIQKQTQEAEMRKIQEDIATGNRQRLLAQWENAMYVQRMKEILPIEHAYRKEEADDRLKGEKELKTMEITAQKEIANIRQGAGQFDEFFANPSANSYLMRAKMGTMGDTDAKKEIPTKLYPQFFKYLADNGYSILPQKKVDNINAIEQMGDMLPKIREMINLQHTNPINVLLNPTSEAGARYAALQRDIREKGTLASVAISGVRRMSNPEMSRFDEYFLPSKIPGMGSYKANMERYNSFKNDLSSAIGLAIKGTSDNQAHDIISNLRSKGLHYMQLQVPPEEENQQTQPGLNIYTKDPKTGRLTLQPPGTFRQ